MIEKQCRNAKQPIPDWLKEKRMSRPKLAIGLDFYLNAFWDLCTERVYSEIVVNLSWSNIQMYADHYEMDFADAEQFHYIIKKIDNAYVKQMRENGKSSELGKST